MCYEEFIAKYIKFIPYILNLSCPSDVPVQSLVDARSAWSASCPAHAGLVAQCTSASDKARIIAVSEKESGHWLHALPSHSLGTILDRISLRMAVCSRLRIKVCEPHYCPCGIRQLGHHGLSCNRSAGRLNRDGAINDIVRRGLTSASILAQLEPSGLFRDDGKRPYAMTIVPWSMGRALVWDATCVDTLAASHLPTNRPDIVLVDRSVRRAIIVDINIPHDNNLVKAEKEKVSKYLDLAHEITAMWNVNESTVVVPIVVSVNGLLAKSFDQHLKKLSLGCWIKSRIQKAVVLETARIVRRFLTLEP
ncbi:jg20002 [Pararge aegeria aegeria]|uniref:Jg20002 protein n=1 Tax=Pararge aegeria aegeria TaxID=348720 RepID=A0A8S4R921_9NEOP|nr:jg20002 [Pararge aegeria aegeria]